MNGTKLTILAVDDEQYALMDLQSAIKEALPDADISCFDYPAEALQFAKQNRVDIAFLDIEMGGMSGIELAKQLKAINGKTNIVFVTGYSEYAIDSYSLDTSDYLMKPVSKELLLRAMERLREPVGIKTDKRVRVQTFGNFEIFADEKPLLFTHAKTKELLAYLIDRRGAVCNNNEIMAVIWEDKTDSPSLKSYFRILVADLTQTLKTKGIPDILVKHHNHLGILPGKISCDLYDYINSVPYAVKMYTGEYMAQFSWAEGRMEN